MQHKKKVGINLFFLNQPAEGEPNFLTPKFCIDSHSCGVIRLRIHYLTSFWNF
jgi:hypothetical protein